jgi:hypothetical protein
LVIGWDKQKQKKSTKIATKNTIFADSKTKNQNGEK